MLIPNGRGWIFYADPGGCMRPAAARWVLWRPSSKAATALAGSKTGRSRFPSGFECPLRRDTCGREARPKEVRVNDEPQQRVVTVLAAGMTFALSRLVTQRLIRVPECRA